MAESCEFLRTIGESQSFSPASRRTTLGTWQRVETRDTQVRSYVDDGYLVVSGLLGREEVEEIKSEIVQVARRAQADPDPAHGTSSDDAILRDTLAVHHPHLVSPVLEGYVMHPVVSEVLARITGAHLPHWDGRVKAMQTMAFVKPPGFPGQAWHQDEVFIPTRDRSLLGAWIAIDDATVANGCLWVLPGSHRTGYLYPLRDHDDHEEFDAAQESYGFSGGGTTPRRARLLGTTSERR